MTTNLNDLIWFLENTYSENENNTIENLKTIMENYNGVDWRKYADVNKDFNRKLIYRSENLELLLISWKKDYSTEYHFHPKNGCLLRILEGTLMENIKLNDNITTNFYGQNNVSYMHDNKGSHKITALSQTFSLHLYSPPGFFNL
jgi:cysteine dioxygenase